MDAGEITVIIIVGGLVFSACVMTIGLAVAIAGGSAPAYSEKRLIIEHDDISCWCDRVATGDFCASCGIFFDDTIHFHRVKVECDNQNVDDEGGNSKMCYVCCGCYEIHKSKYVAP